MKRLEGFSIYARGIYLDYSDLENSGVEGVLAVSPLLLGWLEGFEPSATGSTIRRSTS
jgi:hypothetical protein